MFARCRDAPWRSAALPGHDDRITRTPSDGNGVLPDAQVPPVPCALARRPAREGRGREGECFAASELNRAVPDCALRSLENFGLAIAASTSTFGNAKSAATILAFYRFLKKDAAAAR